MRYVNVKIPFPSFPISSLTHLIKDLKTGWKYRRGDETPRPIDLKSLKVDTMLRHEFPKDLSQPGANTEPLISEVLQKFRGKLERGTPVASSFRSSSGVVKMLMPPPCEKNVIPKILEYEARVQIQTDLPNVEWRALPAGDHTFDGDTFCEGEFILTAVESSVVEKIRKRFEPIGSRLDLLTNDAFLAAEVARLLVESEPDSATAVLEMHSDYSSLTVLNRTRLWRRNIPLGGNSFTNQLSSAHHLPFANAEHLKVQAMQAEDPQSVFVSMKPVFEDLVSELDRSLKFWMSLNRGAKIGTLYVTGGPSKLPGVCALLGIRLGVPVSDISAADLEIEGVDGENGYDHLSSIFLAAQRLGFGMFRTNFLPRSRGFGLGARSAWGIMIGAAGITAAKVSLKR